MIDYSCDFCRNVVEPNTKIPRNRIREWRESVKFGKLARGGRGRRRRKTMKFLKKLKK